MRAMVGAVRLLYLSPFLPWPADHGGRIRAQQVLRAIQSEHDVHVICGVTDRDERQHQQEFRDATEQVTLVPVGTLSHRLSGRARFRKYLKLARGKSSLPSRFESAAMMEAVRSRVQSFEPEGIVVDQIWPCVHRSAFANLPFLISAHNVESEVLHRKAAHLGAGFLASMTRMEARRMRQWESQQFRNATRILSCAPTDQKLIQELAPQTPCDFVPNGFDLREVPVLPAPRLDPLRMAFVGSYDYGPNLDAARTLIIDVLPRVQARYPTAEVVLIGRGAESLPTDLVDRPGVLAVGRVESISQVLVDVSCLVFPISYGGGSRLKIIEGLALGRPVVTTGAGAEGLNIKDGQHYSGGESPEALADAVHRLTESPDLCRNLIEEARSFAMNHHDWSHLEGAIKACVRTAFQKA